MLSWRRSNQRGFCDSRKRVKTRQRGETIVTVTNWLPRLNSDSWSFPARPSITAASINGENLNDKTISHEQTISLSPEQGGCLKVTECAEISLLPYGIWFCIELQASLLHHDRMCESPNVFLSVTFGSTALPQGTREHNGKLTKRQALGHLIGDTQPFSRLQQTGSIKLRPQPV